MLPIDDSERISLILAAHERETEIQDTIKRLENEATITNLECAEARHRVVYLEDEINLAFLAAVHDGAPCPLCRADTSNVWPHANHTEGCPVPSVDDALRKRSLTPQR